MMLSEETSRQSVFAITGKTSAATTKKKIYGLADILTIFQEKIYRTLEYCIPAWLDDIIVVTRGDRKDHEKKMFDVLRKLENAGYKATAKNLNSSKTK